METATASEEFADDTSLVDKDSVQEEIVDAETVGETVPEMAVAQDEEEPEAEETEEVEEGEEVADDEPVEEDVPLEEESEAVEEIEDPAVDPIDDTEDTAEIEAVEEEGEVTEDEPAEEEEDPAEEESEAVEEVEDPVAEETEDPAETIDDTEAIVDDIEGVTEIPEPFEKSEDNLMEESFMENNIEPMPSDVGVTQSADTEDYDESVNEELEEVFEEAIYHEEPEIVESAPNEEFAPPSTPVRPQTAAYRRPQTAAYARPQAISGVRSYPSYNMGKVVNSGVDIDEQSLGTRARRAAPNDTHLRLYEDGVRKLKERRNRDNVSDAVEEKSLNTRAKLASPNKAQLRLYSSKLGTSK